MFSSKLLFLSVLLLLIVVSSSESTTNAVYFFVTPSDKLKLKLVFEDAWKIEDVAVVHYAISSYRILKEELPVSEQTICGFIQKIVTDSPTLESLYHITAIAKDIPTCLPNQLVRDVGLMIIQEAQKENVAIEDLYYIVSSLKFLKANITDVAFISRNLKNILKSNDTLLNIGYAFHIGTILLKQDMENLYDKIDHVISQADEVDGQLYQFDGGLTLTSLIIEGMYKLCESLNKAPPLNNNQLVKFLNYFFLRLSVSRPRGVYGLLQVLAKLNDNNFHTFLSLSVLPEKYLVSKSHPLIAIQVSDLFGEPLVKADSVSLTVSVVSVQRKDSTSVMIKKPFSPTSDKITYILNAEDLSIFNAGYYKFKLSVTNSDTKSQKPIVNQEHNVKFIVVTNVKIENFQIGVIDAEQSSTVDMNKLQFPKKVEEILSVDLQQRIVIKFSLEDVDFGKLNKVHQAFVKLINRKTKNEATFVCQSDSSRGLKLSIDMSNIGNALEYASGEYDLILIIGDILLSSSIKWPLAVVRFKFGHDQISTRNQDFYYYFHPKLEIKHLFKEPERRPATIVSNVFTGFAILPLFILLIFWTRLGVNLKHFPYSFSAFGFHFGLGSIFLLFTIFWLQLNMFQTIKYLLILGIITFLCGNKMLCAIASKRKK